MICSDDRLSSSARGRGTRQARPSQGRLHICGGEPSMRLGHADAAVFNPSPAGRAGRRLASISSSATILAFKRTWPTACSALLPGARARSTGPRRRHSQAGSSARSIGGKDLSTAASSVTSARFRRGPNGVSLLRRRLVPDRRRLFSMRGEAFESARYAGHDVHQTVTMSSSSGKIQTKHAAGLVGTKGTLAASARCPASRKPAGWCTSV